MDSDKKHTWDKVNDWAEELDLLQSIIAKTEVVETIKWGGLTYTVNGKNVLGIGGFKNFFTIWFYQGVFLEDKNKVLVNANEGVTKALRQWRFFSKEDINESLILLYIKEAIANSKAGKEIKPEKKKAIVSELFNKELDADKLLAEAFATFSVAKQNEFLEHIESAKQEKTKLSRIEKIKPLIFQKIGLNDKYK
ncbi:DUF1801 domain-containing protein [Flavobacterium soli]|uniref:DUF1801 domain-containing protein n=1 Tax=Flavobacterium soli TaxID=344881 RepID=UPI00042964C6